MGQTESPQTQVGCSVGDAAQAELNGVDGLIRDDVSHADLQTHTAQAPAANAFSAHSNILKGLYYVH